MAELLLNNLSDAKDIICFDSVPNIVTVKSPTSRRVKAYAELRFNNTNINTMTENTSFTINGYTVNGTKDISQANGRRFFIPTDVNDKNSLALNVMNAFKNISQLEMMYDFTFTPSSTFKITAKGYGAQYNIKVQFSSDTTVTINDLTNSSVTNELMGNESSKIYMDLYYKRDSLRRLGAATESTLSDMVYVTTLEKEFYNDDTHFNISPILTTLSENDSMIQYKLNAYASVDGVYKAIGETSSNYCVKGYLCNQGDKYIDYNDFRTYLPALNVKTGTNTSSYNKSTLYIYDPLIVFTVYYGNSSTFLNYTIRYLDSDETQMHQETARTLFTTPYRNVATVNIKLNENYLRDAYFIDVVMDFGTLRYTVINPPYANVENNRIYWYNSYGGLSFFDFTAEKKQERKTELSTYNKSVLEYYEHNVEEQEIVYSKNVNIETTLTTHLMDENGLYQLYDLQESYTAWIEMDDNVYYIIVSEVKVEEPSEGVYRATVKYKYSLMDSFN